MKIVLNSDQVERKKAYVLKIKNIQQITDAIYIRVRCLTNPFSYSIKETVSATISANVVKLILKPQEEAEMTIVYDPQAFGKSEAFLPTYLESDLATKMHTTIGIIGIFQEPVIKLRKRYVELIGPVSGNVIHKAMLNTNDDYRIYCRPLPEYSTTFSLRLAEFLHHNTNCELSFKFDGDEDMKIAEGGDKIWIDGTTYKMSFRIINLPQKTRIYTGFYEVSCSCGGFWRRPVIGAYENSFLTTYAFSQMYLKHTLTGVHRLPETSSCCLVSRTEEYAIVEFWHLFPLFPTAPDLFTAFMEGCVHAVEMWVYTQGFFKETYYGIPKCINDIYTKEDKKKKKKQNSGGQQGDIPYVRLLNNLIGPQVNNYLGVGQFPSDKTDQVKYTVSVFQKALDLLKELGGTFTYMSPEFLLPFDFFDIFRSECARETTAPHPLFQWTETFEEYNLLAKQSWLDLLLQTYKVLYLSRLPTAKKENVTYCPPMDKFLNKLPNLYLSHYHLYSKNEQVIIAWCQYHYDNPESNIWSDEQLPDKVVSVVGDCFQDGLVFAAVTCAYCPYLIDHLKTMYPHPVTAEGYTHNIHSIIESWEMLNYSFAITSDDVLKPNSVRMLMLIAYLYDILPSMYPNETMVFKAGLSLSVTNSLTLSNPNDYPIAYKPIIIPENYIFKINQEKVVISPKKKAEIQIIYHAKFAREFSCTLLLSGEIRGYHYAKNKCLTLIGIPDLTYPSTVITYPAYQYEISDLDLVIQSPYVALGSYELRQTVDVLHSYEELEATKMYTNKTRFNDDRVVITNNIFISNSEGVIQIEGIIRTINVTDTSTFLYFSNPQLGDFMVRIDTKWHDTYKSEDVFVTLPMEFCENPIIYSERNRLTINIPLSNNLLWNTVKVMTNKLVDNEDKPAWKSLLDMPSGRLIATRLYHMHRLCIPCVGNNEERPLVYTVTTDKDCNINLPSEITIRSEYEEGTVEIEWTLKPFCRIPTNFVMTLRSIKFPILRRYRIIFRYENTKRI